ncbi:MAG: sulfite exporter TauE/SafE family protein [bacterium]
MIFPASGVETPLWQPPLVAFVVSYFTSMAGISGAFLLLPYQMSCLGFTSPAVSSTNLVFNILAIPGGVYRYLREHRMVWPLTWVVVAGTLPGVFVGGLVRVRYLPDPQMFKIFVGFVLLYLALRLLGDLLWQRDKDPTRNSAPTTDGSDWRVTIKHFTVWRLVYVFRGAEYGCSVSGVFLFSLLVGAVGGIYGIGGGSIMAPFLVTIFRLPLHTIAGSTLMATFVTSVFGVAFYQWLAPGYAASELTVAPDWLLGMTLGVGGVAGIYLGARTQRFVPARLIKAGLVLILFFVAARYLRGLIGI